MNYEINNNIDIKKANTYKKRLIGLMFKKDVDYGLLIEIKNPKIAFQSSIHTCFMFFTINLYFLDENKRIFEIKTLKPWKYYKPSKKAKYILEIKEGLIEKNKLKIGDIINLNKLEII